MFSCKFWFYLFLLSWLEFWLNLNHILWNKTVTRFTYATEIQIGKKTLLKLEKKHCSNIHLNIEIENMLIVYLLRINKSLNIMSLFKKFEVSYHKTEKKQIHLFTDSKSSIHNCGSFFSTIAYSMDTIDNKLFIRRDAVTFVQCKNHCCTKKK